MSKQDFSSDKQNMMDKKYLIIEKILQEDGAENVTKLDLQNHTALFDVMYVSTGLSQRHIATIMEKISVALKKIDGHFIPCDGEGTDWGVVDGGDMVVHILTQQARDRYRLEDLWSKDFDALKEAVVKI